MIEGVVNTAYEAVISLSVRGPAGQSREVEAVIDTGFNQFLLLPPALVTELGLSFVTSGAVVLSNGAEETIDVYDVSVIWDGQPRDVFTYMANSTPLVGMLLLDRHSLQIDVESGGSVVIQARA